MSNPSAKIRLRLVLEEFGANPYKDPPSKPITKLHGVDDKNDTLKPIEDPEAPAGITRFLLVDKNADITTRGDPALHKKDAKGLTHEIPGIIPLSAEWDQTGIRSADTLKFKIKWIDFPIDPRCVRACAVEFYLGCVSDEEHARGIAGGLRVDDEGNGPGEPLNVVPDEYSDAFGELRTNRRFQGWIDKWELEWGEDEPVVNFECRDNTQLLIKQEAPSKLVASAVSDEIPIDEAVAKYLKHFPQMEGLTVEYRPLRTPREDVPRLKKVLAKTAFVPELGPQQSKGGGGGEKLSVWDYLTDICGAIGHTIRVDGTSIIIQKASTMLRSSVEPRQDDPYKPRVDEEGNQFPVRAMIFGRNIAKLKMSREFNKKEPSNIEVRCYDPHLKTILVVRSPKDLGDREKSAKVSAVQPGDKSENKWTVLRVSGIRDKAMLQSIADEAYEQLGRGELTAEIETMNMWSFAGDENGLDPDLLDMKPTDIIEILLNRDADFSTMSNIEKALTTQEMNALTLRRLGFFSDFAEKYAKTYADSGFQRAFKVRSMKCAWGIEEGVTLSIVAANFVVARLEKDTQADKDKRDDDAAFASNTDATQPKKPKPGGAQFDADALDAAIADSTGGNQ